MRGNLTKTAGLARLARFFILLVQNKEPKQKDTPPAAAYGSPALLPEAGGLRNSP